MTTAVELRNSIISRAFGFFEPSFADFREVDFEVIQIILDVAFCGTSKVADIRTEATERRISLRKLASVLCKLEEKEMIFPCTDPRTGTECVQLCNFEDIAPWADISEMKSLA